MVFEDASVSGEEVMPSPDVEWIELALIQNDFVK